MTVRTRLAVLGSPISHSLSPAIHAAAYGVLGLDWSYGAVDVTGESLSDFVSTRDDSWRGLSLTMPLKRDILPLLDSREELVQIVGAANTVLWSEDGSVRGFNTDVYGVEQSFRDAGVHSLETVRILGAGATAASVLAGVVRLGATRVVISARTPSRAAPLELFGKRLGVELVIEPWESVSGAVDVVVSTVPGGEDLPNFTQRVRENSVLFDVAYDPWPSALAQSWSEVGGTVISGLDLLVNQAVCQIRIFVGGDPSVELRDEATVVTAMRAALHQHE